MRNHIDQSDLSCDNSFKLGVQRQEWYVWCSGEVGELVLFRASQWRAQSELGLFPVIIATMCVHMHIYCVCVCVPIVSVLTM